MIEEISTFRYDDYVRFIGHYLDLLSGSEADTKSLEDRGYTPEVLKLVKQQKADEFEGARALGLEFTIPLDNFRSDIMNYALTLFQNYERGLLPFPGSVSEQPAQIMEIFSVLTALKLEQEEKQRKKLESNERRQRKNQFRNN